MNEYHYSCLQYTPGIFHQNTLAGDKGNDIFYWEMKEGRHDIPTWGKAMPEFLKWGWGK